MLPWYRRENSLRDNLANSDFFRGHNFCKKVLVKHYAALIPLLLNAFIVHCQGWEWQRYGRQDIVVLNESGDVYNAGQYQDSISIQKFSSNGTLQWQKALKGRLTLAALVLNNVGNLVVAGNFSTTVSIDSAQLTSSGMMNGFLTKLDGSNGKLIGSTVLGSSGQTFVNDLFLSKANGYVIAGSFTDTTDFNGFIIPGDTFHNAFFAKLDTDFNVLWAERSTLKTDYPGEVTQIDEIVETDNGNYYLVLTFQGCLVDLAGHEFENSGRYLIKLDSSRKFKWDSYIEYPGFHSFTSDLQCYGDTAFMKQHYHHHGKSTMAIFRWDSAKVSRTVGFHSNNLAYGINNRKVYYAFAQNYYNFDCPLYDRRSFGIMTTELKGLKQFSDSLIFPFCGYYTLYNDMVPSPSENAFYLCGYGEEIAAGQFLGKFSFDILTDIEEHHQDQFTLFPNPCQDDLKIDLKNNSNGTIYIYTLTGEIVYHREVSSEDATLDISSLRPGCYVLRCDSLTGVYSKMFVKVE